jgi:phosphohistidine phosphatase
LLLIIVRHGEAEPKSSPKPDEERHLTEEGSKKLRKSLMLVKELVGRVDLLLSSPLVRARESAEIAKEVFGIKKVEIDSSLEPESTPYELFNSLSKYSKIERVVLVSHQPFVSHLLASVLNWDGRYFSLMTGAIAIIEIGELKANSEGVLLALLP